jgi:hypothetical protein
MEESMDKMEMSCFRESILVVKDWDGFQRALRIRASLTQARKRAEETSRLKKA